MRFKKSKVVMPVEDMVIITKVRAVGDMKIKLTSENKKDWSVVIANKPNREYKYIKVTADEAKELAQEILDLLKTKI